ncbi:hypothetical protein HY213_01335, partial [Candidatus Peregrinibacteria bacterium]|nr:hypothetical protein [Candidatus Peregrinibacteria bacterium]
DRTIDCIASDHAPHALEEKNEGRPLDAPSGVPGVETLLPLLLSVAHPNTALTRWPHPMYTDTDTRITYADILRLCFTNPNRIFQLGKTGIKEGAVSDLILVDPEMEWTIRGTDLHSKCGWTPYEGWRVKGKVVRGFWGGEER